MHAKPVLWTTDDLLSDVNGAHANGAHANAAHADASHADASHANAANADASYANASYANAPLPIAMSLLIKENCWKWDAEAKSFFVKYYKYRHVAEKVKMIHKYLGSIEFPYHIELKKNYDPHIIIQPWFEAKSANYDFFDDRFQAVETLQALHETNRYINWARETLLPHYSILDKWAGRLQRFKQHEKELISFLGEDYETIIKIATTSLEKIRQIPIPLEKQTLLHGDVVHHNFLMREGEAPKLIDFDLASIGYASDEMILWLQRVLPNVSYNLVSLLQEHEYLAVTKPKLPYLLFPNEVMREALYLLRVDEGQREQFQAFLVPFIKNAIANWERLRRTISMISVK